jgi:DNA end-binding protein Ku
MPRASWKGFLRLSLISCRIYLSPATTRTKSIRLHQVWQPKAARALSEDVEDEEQPYQEAGRSSDDDTRGDTRPEPPPRIADCFRARGV